MKLALIRRRFAFTGGAELYLQRLLQALRSQGHDLHLFTESWDQAGVQGITVHVQAAGSSRTLGPWTFAENTRRALAREAFDCVFSLERTLEQDVYRAGDGVHAVWLERRRQFARWWRRPFLGHSRFHRAVLRLERQVFDPSRTRHIIVNSDMVRGEILERFPFPPERIHLIRNGIELDRFHGARSDSVRAQARRRFGLSPDDWVWLMVGSGWERKGLRFALEALRAYPDPRVRLLVVGKDRPWRQSDTRVRFVGPLRDVEQAYACADLLLCLPIYEPAANVVGEAMAAQLPVITTAQNGAAEWLVPKVNGSTVDRPDDIPAILRALEYWRSHRPAVSAETIDSLSLQRNVAATIAVLTQAAAERRARSGSNLPTSPP